MKIHDVKVNLKHPNIQGDSEVTAQRQKFLNTLNFVYFFIKIIMYDQNKWKIMQISGKLCKTIFFTFLIFFSKNMDFS